jgi:hypothetical protein
MNVQIAARTTPRRKLLRSDQAEASMSRRWIPVIVFWILFITSIGLGKRYAWLDTVWYVAGMLFLLGISVYSIVHILRHRYEADSISYRGIPRWLERFSTDETDQDERTKRS